MPLVSRIIQINTMVRHTVLCSAMIVWARRVQHADTTPAVSEQDHGRAFTRSIPGSLGRLFSHIVSHVSHIEMRPWRDAELDLECPVEVGTTRRESGVFVLTKQV